MSGRFLLDTNIVIAFLERDTVVQEHFAEAEAVFIPSTAIGELYYGAYKSARVAANLARVDEFVAITNVLVCDNMGRLRIFYERRGDLSLTMTFELPLLPSSTN